MEVRGVRRCGHPRCERGATMHACSAGNHAQSLRVIDEVRYQPRATSAFFAGLPSGKAFFAAFSVWQAAHRPFSSISSLARL